MRTIQTALTAERFWLRLTARAIRRENFDPRQTKRDALVVAVRGDRFRLWPHKKTGGNGSSVLCGRVLPAADGVRVRYFCRKSVPVLLCGCLLLLPLVVFAALLYQGCTGGGWDWGGLLFNGALGALGLYLLLRPTDKTLRRYLQDVCKEKTI